MASDNYEVVTPMTITSGACCPQTVSQASRELAANSPVGTSESLPEFQAVAATRLDKWEDFLECSIAPVWLAQWATGYEASSTIANGQAVQPGGDVALLRSLAAEVSASRDRAPPGMESLLGLFAAATTRKLTGSQPVTGCQEITFYDTQLSEWQRELVQRALKSREGLVIQGPPASGKTRVVAELIRQCLQRQQRVVVTATRCETLHALIRRLSDLEGHLAVYLPASKELLAALPKEVQRWLAQNRAQELLVRWRSALESAWQVAEKARKQLRQTLELLQEADTIAGNYAQEQAHLQALQRARQALCEKYRQYLHQPDVVDDEPLRAVLDAEKRKHESALADLFQRRQPRQQQRSELQQQCAHWRERLAYQQRVVAVKRKRAFWHWLWWRSLFQARSEQRLAEFQTRLSELEQELRSVEEDLEQIEQAIQREHQRHATAQQQIIQSALESHCASLDAKIQAAESRIVELTQHWQECWKQMPTRWIEGEVPAWPDTDLVKNTLRKIRHHADEVEQQLVAVQHWRGQLPNWNETWPAHLPYWASLLIASPVVLAQEKSLRRADWMIVLDAHELPQQTWQTLRDSARHWVLCGEPVELLDTALSQPKVQVAALQQWWQDLGGAPLTAPCRWLQTGSGITCQMVPYSNTPILRSWTEPLADQPEVVLRFHELADGQQVLGEVFFPSPKFDIRQAKSFLFQQLEQAIIWPASLFGRWRESEASVVLQWWTGPATVQVSYSHGVHEDLLALPVGDGRTAWRSVAIRFDKAEGWTLESSREWLRDSANVTAEPQANWLWCWHGGVPPLGDWPNWILGLPVNEAAISRLFRVPCPHSKKRAGAGLKRQREEEPINLASEQRKRLPLAWQCVLPSRGYVYPQHARQLLQRCCEWAPSLLTHASHWAVIGWWDKAQLELIRLMAQDEVPELQNQHWCWLSITQCKDVQADGVLVDVDSLRYWPEAVRLQDWIVLGAVARCCLVLLEPDYRELFRQRNSLGHNPIWLTDLLQRLSRLPVMTAQRAAIPPAQSSKS